MRRLTALAVPALVAVVVLGGCGAPSGSPLDLPDGSAARRWGDGPYGLVLVHDAGPGRGLLGCSRRQPLPARG